MLGTRLISLCGAVLVGATSLAVLRSSEGPALPPDWRNEVRLGPNETLLTENGSVLFYNDPITATVGGSRFLAYQTHDGRVILKGPGMARGREMVIHSYDGEPGDPTTGPDDHAAPAVLAEDGRLLVATARHNSAMYVYSFDIATARSRLLTELPGSYTYPRLFRHSGETYLLARKRPAGGRQGDLTLVHLSEDAPREFPVVEAAPGSTVYAGVPAISRRGMILTYSVFDPTARTMTGFTLVEYDLAEHRISRVCDLDHLVTGPSVANRPTGVGVRGDEVLVATAYTDDQDAMAASNPSKDFRFTNKVVVARGDLSKGCSSFRPEVERDVVMPFYHTDVAIDENLNYLFLDDERAYSNKTFPGCFRSAKMFYPRFVPSGIIYAVMNRPYSINEFHTSLVRCTSEPQESPATN